MILKCFKTTWPKDGHPLREKCDVVVSPMTLDVPDLATLAKAFPQVKGEKRALKPLGNVYGWYTPTQLAVYNGLYLALSSDTKVDLYPTMASPIEVAQALMIAGKLDVAGFASLPTDKAALLKWADNSIALLPTDHPIRVPKADIPADARMMKQADWKAEMELSRKEAVKNEPK